MLFHFKKILQFNISIVDQFKLLPSCPMRETDSQYLTRKNKNNNILNIIFDIQSKNLYLLRAISNLTIF